MTTTSLQLPYARIQRASGVWTAFGTSIALTLIAIYTGGFGQASSEWLHFVTFASTRPDSIRDLHPADFGCLAAMVVIALATAVLVCGPLVRVICGESRTTPQFFRHAKRVPLFAIFMFTIIAEELFARGLFLGVIGHFWQGQVAIYVLFLVGNTIWALVHLSNYPDHRDRNPIRVLPQFVGGIFFTATFLAHGFMAALLVHVAYDMVLFAVDKRNAFNAGEIWSIAINSIYLLLGVAFVGKPLTDLTQWSTFNGKFAIEGWGFWNYFWAVVIISACLSIAGDLLCFDLDSPEEVHGFLMRFLGSIIMVIVLVGGYWLISLMTANSLDRLLILAIVLLFAYVSGSGSSVSRAFWIAIPSLILTLCGMFAIEGFWHKVGFLLAMSIVSIPEELIRRNDT